MAHPLRRAFAWLAASLLLLALGLPIGSSATANAAEPRTSGPPSGSASHAPAPVRPEPLPVERIAPSATEVAQLLRGFAATLTPGAEIQHIRETLPAASAELETGFARTLSVLQHQPSLEALQTLDQLWYARQLDLAAWLDTLTDRATLLQNARARLRGLRETWTLTRQGAAGAGDPPALLQQIDDTLAKIAAAEPLYLTQRDDALDLQGQVAQAVARCESARTRILEAQQSTVGGTLAHDGRPLWSRDLWAQGLAEIPGRLTQIAAAYRSAGIAYLRDPSKRLPLHLGIFIATLTALLAARARVRRWAAEGQDVGWIAAVVDRPFAAAVLVGLMVATSYFSPAPIGVKDLLGALALVPMILLARPFLDRAAHPALYTLGLLFALDRVRQAFGGIPPLISQTIVFTESLAGSMALIWLLAHLRSRVRQAPPGSGPRGAWRLLAWAALTVLGAGLLASLLGYLRLAPLTAPAVLVGGADALWFYAAVEILTAAAAFAFRVWPLRRLRLVQNHGERLLPRIRRWLVVLAVVGWSFRYLDYLGLWEPAQTMTLAALSARLTLGSFSTSAGDVLAFAVTLWAAYLLSAVLRFVLEEEIYPRAEIATGISYATSSLLQYTIAILALFLALGFLGVTLTQVTVFAGALGVGVGFGLQGVVHNFVSGLILLFEQPIHVGDAVQMGDLQGRVRRIGIRASVVRTLDGAEVIIPNSQLTANQVTNWTLSDQQKRLDLPVGVAYGTPPAKVIELLEGVAQARPGILPDPPPRCLFLGYGDSSIDFELRAWTEYDVALVVRSQLTAAVYDAIYAAGMSFPFPQREVRLLPEPGTPPCASALVPSGSEPGEPPDIQRRGSP